MTKDVTPVLQVRDLKHAYPGKPNPLPSIDGVSFDLFPGEILAFLGPSGCGKSTLFRILLGLQSPTSGEVSSQGKAQEFFAYHPQNDELFDWRTIIANGALGLEISGLKRKVARAKARELLPVFGLTGFGDAYPRELSGGMRQRAALLRTVVQGRPVILLDEPFSALDAITRADLHEWLLRSAKENGWTIILITHDEHEARFLCDRIIYLTSRPMQIREVETINRS